MSGIVARGAISRSVTYTYPSKEMISEFDRRSGMKISPVRGRDQPGLFPERYLVYYCCRISGTPTRGFIGTAASICTSPSKPSNLVSLVTCCGWQLE